MTIFTKRLEFNSIVVTVNMTMTPRLLVICITFCAFASVVAFDLRWPGCRRRCLTKAVLYAGKGFGAKPTVAKHVLSRPSMEELQEPCACGSTRSYEECCGVLHYDQQALFDPNLQPDQIVRARYTAYSKGLADFLIATSHSTEENYAGFMKPGVEPSKGLRSWRREVARVYPSTIEYLHLKIDRVDSPDDFASLTDHNKLEVFPENSIQRHAVKFRVLFRRPPSWEGKFGPKTSSVDAFCVEEVSAIIFGEDPSHVHSPLDYLSNSSTASSASPSKARWYFVGGFVQNSGTDVADEMAREYIDFQQKNVEH